MSLESEQREERRRRSREHLARHAAALVWTPRLPQPASLAWLERQRPATPGGVSDRDVAHTAVESLFLSEAFPPDYAGEDLLWLRDPLGKPYIAWQGAVAAWAQQRGKQSRHLHVSNSHDGDASVVLAVYSENLAGLGVDLVHLPRLSRIGKDRDYLLRFAQRFMAPDEWDAFTAPAGQEPEERLRLRVAAHFSLMEAASKACGTGLKMGAGIGKPESLSRYALGVGSLAPEIALLFNADARARLELLEATGYAAYWGADEEYLVSAVLLLKS
ncbi:MAG TPA: 4'-phosphopantetheinyl transferase superfamily protein [Chthonomonadaceae bacterium]|nr:4'-phosphopantetheinyl transferase superfamily protein [Chthonomonadaceae bacterium]